MHCLESPHGHERFQSVSHSATEKSEATVCAGQSTARPGARLRWIFFWLPLLLLVGLVALGPTVVSWTPLGRQLAGRFAPVDGSVEIESLSIGWFTPLYVTGIVARDPAGEIVAQVASVQGDKPLWALLLNRSDLGQFDVDQPAASVVLRDDGSNVEDLLRPLLRRRRADAADERGGEV